MIVALSLRANTGCNQQESRTDGCGDGYDKQKWIRIQKAKSEGDDSDLDDEFLDDEDQLARGSRDQDYRHQVKDLPLFSGSMNIEDFLD